MTQRHEAAIEFLRANSYNEAADLLDFVMGRECHICHRPSNQPGALYCSAPHCRLVPYGVEPLESKTACGSQCFEAGSGLCLDCGRPDHEHPEPTTDEDQDG